MGAGGKNLACVLCCASVPHATHWAQAPALVAAVSGFIRQTLVHGEWEEDVPVNAGGMLLLVARGVSLCEPCLGEVREATEVGQRVEEYEELVRHLQQRLLRLMRELQALVDAYRARMEGLEGKISKSEEGKIPSRNEEAHRFRREVTRVAQNLKGFREDLRTRTGAGDPLSEPVVLETFKVENHVEGDNLSDPGAEEDLIGEETCAFGGGGDDPVTDTPVSIIVASPDPPEEEEEVDDRGSPDNASDAEDFDKDDTSNDPDFKISPSKDSEKDAISKGEVSVKSKGKLVNYNRGFLEAAFTAACPSAASVTRTAKNLNLKCGVCAKSGFETRLLLYHHWWQKHSGRFNNRRQCPTCGKTMTHSALQKHKPKCAAGTVRPWRRRPPPKAVGPKRKTEIKIETQEPDEDAESAGSLSSHDEEEDKPNLTAMQRAFQAACPDAPAREKDPFSPDISCGVCGKKGWSSRRRLYDHWYRNHYNPRRRTDGQFDCEVCGEKGFTTKLSLANHQFRIHGGGPLGAEFRAACPSATIKSTKLSCDVCKKPGFQSRRALYSHWRLVHRGRRNRPRNPRHTCQRCGMSYRSLDNHRRICRAKEKGTTLPAEKRSDGGGQCDECGKVFKNSKSIWYHRKFKHGPPPPKDAPKWPCSICGQQFKNQRLQRLHEANHVPREERPHITCPLCHRKILETSWSKHRRCNCPGLQKQRKEPVKCDDCGKMLRDPNSLKEHRKRKHDTQNLGKPWQCDACGKQFKLEKDLRIHEAEKHLQGELPHKCERCGRGFRWDVNLERHREKCQKVK